MLRHAPFWRAVAVLSSVVCVGTAAWLFVENFPDSRLRWIWVVLAVTSLGSGVTILRLLGRSEPQR